MGAISEMLLNLLRMDQIQRLRKSGYMSPQSPSFDGHGFSCMDCDWFEKVPLNPVPIARKAGMCRNPQIRSPVEAAACCNRFTYHGVHT